MACFLHGQHGPVTEVPYRPVQTIVHSLSSHFKQVSRVAESWGFLPLEPFSSPLVSSSSSGRNDHKTNRRGGATAKVTGFARGSWLMLPIENISCQFERVPALVLPELSSTPAEAQVLPAHTPEGWQRPRLADYRSTTLTPNKDSPPLSRMECITTY